MSFDRHRGTITHPAGASRSMARSAFHLSLLLLARTASTAALVIFPASPIRVSRLSVRPMKHSMGRCDAEGFNSFRRWPSSSTVSLTRRAQRVFGEREMTFDQMRDSKLCDDSVLEKVMDARPMADQRGEHVMLDVDEHGHFEWLTVV